MSLLKEANKTDAKTLENTASLLEQILCRKCDRFICQASSLKRQGSTIICKDTKFPELVKPAHTIGGRINAT
jgi:hypothetical protein